MFILNSFCPGQGVYWAHSALFYLEKLAGTDSCSARTFGTWYVAPWGTTEPPEASKDMAPPHFWLNVWLLKRRMDEMGIDPEKTTGKWVRRLIHGTPLIGLDGGAARLYKICSTWRKEESPSWTSSFAGSPCLGLDQSQEVRS